MSIELRAKLGAPVSLAELFADIEVLLPATARAPLRVVERSEGPESVVLGPFPVPVVERNGRSYAEGYSCDAEHALGVEMGAVARVWLTMVHFAAIGDLEPSDRPPTEQELEDDLSLAGYHVRLDAGYLRTKATFCLAVLLATAIARRSGARIHDDAGRLCGREWVEVSTVLAMFEQHADAQSFEAFADAFCNDIGLAPHWPDSATLVRRLPPEQ